MASVDQDYFDQVRCLSVKSLDNLESLFAGGSNWEIWRLSNLDQVKRVSPVVCWKIETKNCLRIKKVR